VGDSSRRKDLLLDLGELRDAQEGGGRLGRGSHSRLTSEKKPVKVVRTTRWTRIQRRSFSTSKGVVGSLRAGRSLPMEAAARTRNGDRKKTGGRGRGCRRGSSHLALHLQLATSPWVRVQKKGGRPPYYLHRKVINERGVGSKQHAGGAISRENRCLVLRRQGFKTRGSLNSKGKEGSSKEGGRKMDKKTERRY